MPTEPNFGQIAHAWAQAETLDRSPEEAFINPFEKLLVLKEYESGERSVDQQWLDKVFADPETGEALEGLLRLFVGAGRRDPEDEAAVEADTQLIIAAILDPTIVLDEANAARRDQFLLQIDQAQPRNRDLAASLPDYSASELPGASSGGEMDAIIFPFKNDSLESLDNKNV